MREAAADLNFEEAARLRDEVKRLRATEMAVVDDPTAKQRTVQGKAGAYAGTKKYGEAANLPVSAMKKRRQSARPGASLAPHQRRRLEGRRGSRAAPAVQRSTNPISTKCTARNPCPIRPDGGAPSQARPRQRQQNLPAHRLAPVRPRVRPRPAIKRRRTGASGWVEEEVSCFSANELTATNCHCERGEAIHRRFLGTGLLGRGAPRNDAIVS